MKRHRTKPADKPRKLELSKERLRDLTKQDHEKIAAGMELQVSDTNNTGLCITTS